MPQISKKSKRDDKPAHMTKARLFYSTQPWEPHHHKDHSEIVAYVETSGKWETILNVHQTSGVDHETMAHFIVAILSEHQEKRSALHEAMEALELVINDGLPYSSEQVAERAMTNIKRLTSGRPH